MDPYKESELPRRDLGQGVCMFEVVTDKKLPWKNVREMCLGTPCEVG
jgi:hypothetical protein